MNFTQWFLKGTLPARIGVYQRNYTSCSPSVKYCYWDGERWGQCSATVKEAINNYKTQQYSLNHFLEWRGVAK